jgi:hypothetical protein
MFEKRISFSYWLNFLMLFLVAGLGSGLSEDTAASDKYNDDYDNIQRIVAITQPARQAEQFIGVLKSRPDLDEKLKAYVSGYFIRDMDALTKQRNFSAIKDLSEKAIKANPKFGEAYYYFGMMMKQENKLDEAVKAFAACFVLPNSYQQKAKPLLDATYRAKNNGSIVGEDKMITALKNELKVK